jgi:hypothetical protein
MIHMRYVASLFVCLLIALQVRAGCPLGPAGTGTCGMIATRPTCSPGVSQVTNYVQSPEALRRANGDIDIIVDAGNLQPSGEPWEGLFVLRYPAGANVTRHWYPIWAANNWGEDTARNEREAAHPSAILQGGLWRIAYSSTADNRPDECTGTPGQVCSNNWDRVGRIDTPELIWRAESGQVTTDWIRPVDPACATDGSCKGVYPSNPSLPGPPSGSGLLPAYAVVNGKTFLYHQDGTAASYKGCPTSWIRSLVQDNQTTSFDRCIAFSGTTPGQIWDIGRGTDGKLYMLAPAPGGPQPAFPATITEWQSTGAGDDLGTTWSQTLRWWAAPSSDGTQGAPALPLATDPPAPLGTSWAYVVDNGTYLKNEDRSIVEPRVIVSDLTHAYCATCGSPGNGGPLSGSWYLYYWADAAAPLPPNFGGSAGQWCTFGGNLDVVNASTISGWLWDSDQGNTPLYADIYDGTTLIAHTLANIPRPELAALGIGNGVHGFAITAPASLQDGHRHHISVRYGGTNQTVSGEKDYPPLDGYHDGTDCNEIVGWAWNNTQPNTATSVDVFVDGSKLTTITAGIPRPDLVDANIGNGSHGFSMKMPDYLKNGQSHEFTIKHAGIDFPLQLTPRSVSCAPSSCSFSITPQTVSVGSAGGTTSINITTGPNCSWAAGTAAAFVSISAPTGTGGAVITLTVGANTSSTARSATVTVAGTMVTLSQAGTAAVDLRRGDMNGDGAPDVIWRNQNNGDNFFWRMSGVTLVSSVVLPGLSNTSFTMGGVGDFNADGIQDIVWENLSTGQVALWLMNSGNGSYTIVNLPNLPPVNYEVVGVADFDGNGTPDLLIRNQSTGLNAVWMMNGTAYVTTVNLPSLSVSGYELRGAADFDHDGVPDLIWQNKSTGANALWLMQRASATSYPSFTVANLPGLPINDYLIQGAADYDGNGTPDLLIRNQSTALNALWMMNGTNYVSTINLSSLTGSALIRGPR